MAGRQLPRGITLLDLITQVPQAAHGVIPDFIARFLELLSVVESHSRASITYDIVEGTVRPLADVVGIDVADGFPVELPGLTHGMHFEYAANRVVPTPGPPAQNLEPAPTPWQLTLFADRIQIPFPGTAARRAEATEGFVGPLVADPDRERVHAWLRGAVRISNASGAVVASLVSDPSPFAPDGPSGQVLRGGLDPRHVLFGANGFGMTVGDIIWDQTTAITPPEIVARGHDAAWQGLSVADATLYLPRDLPFLGDVTAGVRDLLIGFAPDNGVQLDAFLQFGEPSRLDTDDEAHKIVVHFYQDVDGQIAELDTPSGPTLQREVEIYASADGEPARILARLSPADAQARWRLPYAAAWTTGNDTGWFVVRPGDPHHTLAYRDIFTLVDDDNPDTSDVADGPQITFAFDAANATGTFPPKISLTAGSFTWIDVTQVSGTADDLADITLDAIEPLPPDPDDRERLGWELRLGANTVTGTGPTFAPTVSWPLGDHTIILTDAQGRRRRLEIAVLADVERMVIGCSSVDDTGPIEDRAGPRVLIGSAEEPAVVTAVVRSSHLRSFHQDGEDRPSDEPATLGPPLAVPAGTLAEVALADPTDGQTHVTSLIRVLLDFDSVDPRVYRAILPEGGVAVTEPGFEGTYVDPWGPATPYPVTGGVDVPTSQQETLRGFAPGVAPAAAAAAVLRAWAADVLAVDTNTRFVVIGRTCDIGADEYNTGLGDRRAAQGRDLLTNPAHGPDAVDDALVTYARGENQLAADAVGTLPDDPTVFDELSDPDLQARSLPSRTGTEIRIKADHATEIGTWGERHDQPEREEARCFEVYAVVPDPWQTAPTDDDATSPARQRTLVPGADLWATIGEAPRERAVTFAFRLLAKWDSPSWQDAGDSAPTLVEAAVDWESHKLEIPVLGGSVEADPMVPAAPDEPKVWQVVIRYTSDPRTRQLVLTGAIDTPGSDEGLLRIVDGPDGDGVASDLAFMLGLGPALANAVGPTGAVGTTTSLLVLGGVAATSAIFDIASNGSTTVHRVELGYGRAAGGVDPSYANHVWLYADYTAAFDVDVLGLVTGTGVALRYREAGIELGYDVDQTNLDGLALSYDEAAEIVSPGTWSMSTALARLLGVVDIRMGTGSVWVEVDLAMAIDLGPVTLKQATLRVTIDGEVVFELVGLVVAVDIPGVLEGEGRLAITRSADDDLVVSAALDLTVPPIGLGIEAWFKYEDPMVQLEIAVTFATPIPLLNTGLGLMGLQGRFVSNGTRDLPDEDDPVQRELAWYERDVLDKYEPLPGQSAFGLGATLGTQPDAGFTFNVNGMLVIELPDPSVVLTVVGTFMDVPDGVSEDAGTGAATSIGLLGVVAISDEGVAVGIRGTYGVPQLLDVQVPVAAWFPITGGSGSYVRVGSDGFGGRAGDPVTVTVLPGTLDLRAWAYLMIEEKELPDLGGRADFDFTGFSIGFGAGYDFEWGASAVYLRAASSIIVGLGTKPLLIRGALETGGELRFGPVGVTIEGAVDLTLTKDDAQLTGEFCGEVDLALFKASGCVNITVGSVSAPSPPPEPLVSGLSLADRRARVVAEGPGATAWIDCRPVLHFAHRVLDGLDSGSIAPTPSAGWGADWAGSAKTKFLYRLRAVELLDGAGAVIEDAVGWPSVWWLPAFRPAIPAEGDPPSSEHEGWDLALLAWDLAPWARSLVDGADGAPDDPAVVVQRLCDPVPQVSSHCVYGAHGQRLTPERVRFVAAPTGPLPWRSAGSLEGQETLGIPIDAALVWAGLLGYRYEPGRVAELPVPWVDPTTGAGVVSAWRLPVYRHDEQAPVTVGFVGQLTADAADIDLVLALSMSVPPDGSEVEHCFTFDEFSPDTVPPEVIDYGLVRISGQQTVVDAFGDESVELQWSDTLVVDIGGSFSMMSYASVTRVEATVMYLLTPGAWGEPVQMRAFDIDGTLLAEAAVPDDVSADVPYTLVTNAPGITRVELWAEPVAGGNRLFLGTLCMQFVLTIDAAAWEQSVAEFFEEAAELFAPRVHGTTAAGELEWPPDLVDVVSGGGEVAALVRYRPDAAATGQWTGLRVDATAELDIGIVSSCFTTSSAVEAAEAASDAACDILDGWNSSWNGSEEDRVVLLEPGSDYSVRVRYDVATWNQAGSGGPPSAASLDWDAPPSTVVVDGGLEQTFDFSTADDGSLPEADLLRFDAQSTFDPRAVARYVIGFDPSATRPLHFLDDKLLVHFEVEWIESLLTAHGYELALEVIRTDPPPGTSAGIEDRFVATEVSWSSASSTMNVAHADARLAVAALLAPCVEGPQPQGITACIEADLEPLAAYDLVVRAKPPGALVGKGTVIARTHFATSAYRSPDQLVAALGFADIGLAPDPLFPLEEIVARAGPTDISLGDDTALDTALADLGLDPYPLPKEPGTLLLWVNDGGWKVAGVMLDSTEELERPPRLEDVLDDSPTGNPTIDGAVLAPGGHWVAVMNGTDAAPIDYVEPPARLGIGSLRIGQIALEPRRSNASSTRVLFTADTPFAPSSGGELVMELVLQDRSLTARGHRAVPSVPRLVSQEAT